jgi:hypothetical protein
MRIIFMKGLLVVLSLVGFASLLMSIREGSICPVKYSDYRVYREDNPIRFWLVVSIQAILFAALLMCAFFGKI